MSKVRLGDVAIEYKETCRGSKEGYPIVGLEHLISEDINLTQWNESSENTFTRIFRKGQVLFGRRRAYLKKAAVAPFDGICSGDITVIEAKPDKILPELLPFVIQNDDLFDFAVGKSAGSLSPRVKWQHLSNYEFELPDMDKQRELARLLWAVDATKRAYKKLLAKTDEMVKSQFIEMFGDPLLNPKGVPMKTIGEVCDFEGGSQPPRSTFIFEPKDGYVRLIQIRDYKTDEYMTYIPAELAKKFCRPDDIMIGRYGPPIFQILQGLEGAYNVALMKAVPKYECIEKEFLRFYLKRDEILHHLEMFQQRTVGQAGIEMNELRNYPIPVPTVEEQRAFVDFIQQSDKSKFEMEQALSELTATYKRIITDNLG